MIPVPVIPFISEEITSCTFQTAKNANKASRNLPDWFLVSSFTVSVTTSANKPNMFYKCFGFNNIIHIFIRNE